MPSQSCINTTNTSCATLDDAIRLLVNDNECDEVIEMLQKCSQDLLECDDESIGGDDNGQTNSSQNDRREENDENDVEIDDDIITTLQDENDAQQQLEAIKDLMTFDHLYHKHSDEITHDSGSLGVKRLSVGNSLSPIPSPRAHSPLSCLSDSGYESSHSPIPAFNHDLSSIEVTSFDQMHHDIDTDTHWEQSFCELFPDLA